MSSVFCMISARIRSASLSGWLALLLAVLPCPGLPAAALEDEKRLQFWNNPEFVKRFMASYGVNPAIEPSFETPDEQTFHRELGDVMRETPALAIERLQRRITPSSSAILSFTLGSLLVQEGRVEQAVEQFEVALAKFPDFRRAHRNLGFALARLERYDEAARALTRALQLGANDAGIHGLLGYSYLNADKNFLAGIAYRNALLLDPGNREWRMGLVKTSIARSDFNQALAVLDELLIDNPGSASLWRLQANVYLRQGDLKKAAGNFEMLRRMGEATLANLMHLGDIYMSDNLLGMALPVYLEAIEKDGAGDVRRSLNALEILVDRGAWKEAEELMAKVRELHAEDMNPEDEARLLRQESRMAVAGGDLERALGILEEIVERNPMDGEALLLSGDYHVRQGEEARALVRFEMAARISGFEADAWIRQAQLLVRQQKYSEALELLERAQKTDPRDNVRKYLEAVERVARAAAG